MYRLPLTYIPQKITNNALIVYFAALFLISLLFMSYVLDWKWMVFGIGEVTICFVGLGSFSKSWQRISPKLFTQRLFWISFFVRFLWIVATWWLYVSMCDGDPLGYENADASFYNEVGKGGAQWLRDGNWNLFDYLRKDVGFESNTRHALAFSDTGFPIYMSIVYFLTNDSMFIARVLNCIWGAWTAVMIYKIGQRHFGESTARMAGLLTAFLPTLWYYCGTQLKEVWMVFLCVAFVEEIDKLLLDRKLYVLPIAVVAFIGAYMFMIRTALAAVMIIAMLSALVLSNNKMVKWGKRSIYALLAVLFVFVVLLSNSNIRGDFLGLVDTGGSQQESTMQWMATRKDAAGNQQSFARYAGAAVFAPMIFTLPFPTMVESPGQETIKMINGGNFCKNILSFFTLLAMFMLLLERDWRKHVMPLFVMLGYLAVLVFSNFAQSGRFHQPAMPFEMLFAAYAISKFRERKIYKSGYSLWLAIMFVADIAWAWFKLRGRGMI